jgi:hypothetical protein
LEVFDEFEQWAQWLACHARWVSLWGSASSSVASSGFRVFGPEAGFEDAHRARE